MTEQKPAATTNPEVTQLKPRGPWKILWRRLLKNRVAVIGGILLVIMYLMSCFAGFLSPYRYDDQDPRGRLYGPMLTGGYEAKEINTYIFEDEDGNDVEVKEYERIWSHFKGGIHFHDSAGEFTFRPHIHPLREYTSYDEYGESETLTCVDTSISVPIQMFVQGEEHELVSLFGLFPISGTTHLFGVELPEYVDTKPKSASEGELFTRLYLFGSDRSGRDLLTRILYGGQISLSVGLLGIVISMTIGLIIGGISGYYGGALDFTLMRIVELVMAIPGLYLILTLRYALKTEQMSSRETYVMIVGILALASWASISRIVRGMVLSLRENEYALAAKALGASDARIIARHIIPNTASFVIVTATLTIPYYILGEAGLSFLGLGITEPESSWGLLLKDAQASQILKYSPWLVLPGFFIFFAVLAYNFLGDGLRDAADPRAVLSSNIPPKK